MDQQEPMMIVVEIGFVSVALVVVDALGFVFGSQWKIVVVHLQFVPVIASAVLAVLAVALVDHAVDLVVVLVVVHGGLVVVFVVHGDQSYSRPKLY
ncbi:hypothetical protein WICMUC_002861 [Wickerhamomyces mucosus]|uniref:Transmembrane protein n=1 Tax=Wickerhamomyces mucosus TaxID=1378264 RepID=A0A9P8PPM4_9ASCO|nr:hypothetical protein WICMUC_002861 [Wickerhamomyces mucosus]